MIGMVYLNAVVPVGEVIHGLELLVDDVDTGFVSSDGYFLNVFGGFALFLESSVDMFGCFNGGLRVKFRYKK